MINMYIQVQVYIFYFSSSYLQAVVNKHNNSLQFTSILLNSVSGHQQNNRVALHQIIAYVNEL